MKKIVEYDLLPPPANFDSDTDVKQWVLDMREEIVGGWPPVSDRVLAREADEMVLSIETCELLLSEFGITSKRWVPPFKDEVRTTPQTAPSSQTLVRRPPVVAVMGHVDHGKTTLLDALRNTRVADGEAGGITQAVSSFKVDINSKDIVFIDTPGHEAFSSMRECGAMLTDIVVLVVAATDGVRAQTIESVQHAQACDVPIVVAVTKVDVDGIDAAEHVERISNELIAEGVQCESMGGETQILPISSIRGDGMKELLEALLLEAEIMG